MYETEGGSFSNHKEIDGTRNNSGGIFTSPGYPGNYTHNAVYSWTIKTGNPNSIVHLNFDFFQISEYQNHTPRCKDFLQVKNIICNIALVFMRWYWTLYISIRLKYGWKYRIKNNHCFKKNPNQPFSTISWLFAITINRLVCGFYDMHSYRPFLKVQKTKIN